MISSVNWAFKEDALISKILSSLPSDFFYINSVWDSTSKADKTLLNLSQCLIKEEDKLKLAAQNLVDITKAFYSHSSSYCPPSLPNSSIHLCIGQKCPHLSRSTLSQPNLPKPPSAINRDRIALTPNQRQA